MLSALSGFGPRLPASRASSAGELARRAEQALRSAGYPLARVVAVGDGAAVGEASGKVHLRVFLGDVSGLDVHNSSRVSTQLLERMLSSALCPEAGPGHGCVLQSHRLERATVLVSSLPGVKAMSLGVSGDPHRPGAVRLHADVTGTDHAVQAALSLDNGGLPSTGRGRLGISLSAPSVIRAGDSVSIQLADSQKNELTGLLDWNQPLGSRGLRLDTQYSRTTYSLPLGGSASVTGSAQTVSAGLSYPLALNFDRVMNVQADVGEVRSRAQVSQLGTFQDRKIPYVDLALSGNSGLRSVAGGMNYSLWSAALTYGHPTDGAPLAAAQDGVGAQVLQPFTRLSMQYAIRREFGDSPWSAGLNLRGQMASRNLDPSEALSIGGPGGVRGYPVDEGSLDEGVLATADVSRSYRTRRGALVVPDLFVDYANGRVHHSTWSGWNAGDPSLTNHRTLAAYGVALDVQYRSAQFSVSVARPLPSSPSSIANPSGPATQVWGALTWHF
ncbi:MAG: ShlB/FhaC/HecB family hemolysin secretion/activation protein [Patescibacteria group bacterium]|nr:ShlB/FhaC/HecB family hemolysin secretion/activation protein [Patescibacteria group bacterium]